MLEHAFFIARIQDALSKNELVAFAAHCSVWYSGRAESYLPDGDRLIIIKPDKTLLIHQPAGSAPINYMKEGCKVHINHSDTSLFLNCTNIPLKEYLDIKLNAVHFFESHPMEDVQKIQLAGTEDDMAEMIYKTPELIEPGFKPVSKEEQTKYGFIDVFGYDKNNVLLIVECKRYSADLAAVTQLRRYVEKIKASKGIDKVRGVLAAPRITPNSLKMLEDWGFEFCMLKPPKYLERYDKDQKSLGEFK